MKLIDADKLKLSLCRECSLYPNECLEKNGECDWNSIAHINMMTPVDAVPVIRCKDCKWYYRGGATCMFWDGENSMCGDDYCSWAERKEK